MKVFFCSMLIFFVCFPMFSCTMTPQQTAAVGQGIEVIGKTIAEVIAIYGQPVDMFSMTARVDGMGTETVLRYPDFYAVARDGIVIRTGPEGGGK